MASVAKIRHTVLRLIGSPRTVRTRTVTSARDCRLSGCLVSAISSQATAFTRAWSRGGKSGLAAPSRLVVQGKIAGDPTAAPSLHRTWMQLHPFCGFDVGYQGLLMQQQHQGSPLPHLVLHGSLFGNLCHLLQERRRKLRPIARERPTHGKHPLMKAIVATRTMPLILSANGARKP